MSAHIHARAAAIASREKEYEQIIRQTFEPVIVTENFPRAVISIVVQVIEDNGSISFSTQSLSLCMCVSV